MKLDRLPRRAFLLGGPALALPALGAESAAPRRLRGIFPIAQTPFTTSDKLDVEALAAQAPFLARGRVHGLVWPQLASEWSTLSEAERLEGAEALLAARGKSPVAVVIGVQSQETADAVRYARHAEKLGADAIISLPPPGRKDPEAIVAWYEEIGRATGLPLFAQAVGDIGPDLILRMHRRAPTLRFVKDEAGQPLLRIAALREGSGGKLEVFSGGHGRTLIDEIIRGFAGSMPAASFADLYAAAWDLWHAGQRREAADMFGRAAILIEEIGPYGMESLKYILCLRGVFRTYHLRGRKEAPVAAGARIAAGGGAAGARLDETGKRVLRELLDLLKPHLKG
jgi:4-hydroxy-tetrahydrodipicolinate synthase